MLKNYNKNYTKECIDYWSEAEQLYISLNLNNLRELAKKYKLGHIRDLCFISCSDTLYSHFNSNIVNSIIYKYLY